MPTYVLFSIAYKPPSSAAIKIGTVKVNRANYVNGKTYKIAPLTDWSDITGYVVIDELPDASLPSGVFSFGLDSTRFDTDVVRPSLPGIASLDVIQPDGTIHSMTGSISIKPGTNVRLEVTELGSNSYEFRVHAIQGEGLSTACSCGDTLFEPVRSINKIPADENGNIDIVGSKCLNIEPQTAMIAFSNPCSEPCCGCDEAEALTNALRPITLQAMSFDSTLNKLEVSTNQLKLLTETYNLKDNCLTPELPNAPGQTTTTGAPTTTTTTTTKEPTTTTTTTDSTIYSLTVCACPRY
jgi:hypothetical protein